MEAGQCCTGVNVNTGTSQHPELADPPVRPGPDFRQSHDRIEYEERYRRYQPQCKQIKDSLAVESFVDLCQLDGKASLNGFTQKITA